MGSGPGMRGFQVLAAVSFIAGTLLGWGLIRFFGLGTTEAYIANIVAAVLINYVCRKYLVFKG